MRGLIFENQLRQPSVAVFLQLSVANEPIVLGERVCKDWNIPTLAIDGSRKKNKERNSGSTITIQK